MTDGRTDGRTEGGDCKIPDAFLKKRGDNKKQTKSPSVSQVCNNSVKTYWVGQHTRF